MLDARAHLKIFIPQGSPVGKLTQLPFIGNRLLQTQVSQISVQQLQQRIAQNPSNLLLIDVRYQSEQNIARLPGDWFLVPYPLIKAGAGVARIQKLLQEKRQANPGQEIQVLVLCKAGIRSAHSVLRLQQAGIKAINITGGIHAWNQYIDPSLPLYDIKDIPEFQSSLAKKRSPQQSWLSGCGVALALSAVGAVGAVRYNSDLLRPLMQAGVPLAAASDLPIVGYAIQEASEPVMNVQQLKKLLNSKDQKNYLIVDVRTAREYKLSHLPGAVSLPLPELEQGKGIQEIKSQLKDRELIAYCNSSKRSARALILLHKAGVIGTKVQGGIEAWTKEIDPSLATHKR
jgi:adenylyltransferase/sulfurtransferase